MTKPATIPSRQPIWKLVHLGHELDDIVARLDVLATQLNRGYVDHQLYASTLRQIKKCGQRLETALTSQPRRGA